MTRRRSLILAALAIVLVGIGIGIVIINSKASQVRYHEWRMQRARQQMCVPSQPSAGNVLSVLFAYVLGEGNTLEAFKRYDYHRQKLVELGSVARLHYNFKHVLVPTSESRHLTRLLVSGHCPNCVDFESPYPDKPEPVRLTVWCHPADTVAWNNFIAEHDVADYRGRFMSATGKK